MEPANRKSALPRKKQGHPASLSSSIPPRGKKSDHDQKKQKKGKGATAESTDVKSSKSSTERPQPKDLKSGPLYEKGVVELAAKVKGRKASKKSKRLEAKSREDINYPSIERKKSSRKKATSTEDEVGQSTLLNYDTCAEISEMRPLVQKRLPNSGMPIVTDNKCNDNKLFVKNMPFWWNPDPLDITDDELVMNANVIIDVLENRLKLVPMPDIRIILDPFEDLTVLQARNGQCFTKDIIFGNTVRSMVNLNEMSIRSLQGTSKKQKKKMRAPDSELMQTLAIEDPTTLTLYSRENINERYLEEYKPTKSLVVNFDIQANDD